MSKEPKRNVYVGHRYVPLIMGEWDGKNTYEGLSIVTYKGASYTSKKRVPKGIDILDNEYWELTGNYNAQIEDYRKDVKYLKNYVNDEVENVNNKLNDGIKDITDKVDRNYQQIIDSRSVVSDLIYRKKIVYSLPLRFKDYYAVNNNNNLHPQQLYISERDDRLYIQYTNKGDRSNVIVVYFLNGEYDRCFLINEYGYEGIHVIFEAGKKFMFVNDTSGKFHKYDITNMPNNKSTINPVNTTDLTYEFRYGYDPDNNEMLFQHKDDGNYFDILDNNLKKKNHFRLSGELGRIANRPTINKTPFIQAFTFNSNYVVFSIGRVASNDYEGWNGLTQQGIVITDRHGKILNTGLLHPSKMKEKLENNGYIVDMLENEGVCFSENGTLYSLTTTTWGNVSGDHPDNEGIIVFEEFNNSDDYIDFSNSKMELYGFNNEIYSNSFYPTDRPNVISNKFYHPVTKEHIESILDIAEYMNDYQIPHLKLVKTKNMELKSGDGDIRNSLVMFTLDRVSNTMIIINEKNYRYNITYSYIPSSNTIEFFKEHDLLNKRLLDTEVNFKKGDVFKFMDDSKNFNYFELVFEFHGNLKIIKLNYAKQRYVHTDLNLSNSENNTAISFLELDMDIELDKLIIRDIRTTSKDNGTEWSKSNSSDGLKIIRIDGLY